MEHVATLASAGALYIVLWATLALINAGIAQGKHRSGLAWFLLSLLLGPVGTLILVLMPKLRQSLF